jgi:hypothetical protein
MDSLDAGLKAWGDAIIRCAMVRTGRISSRFRSQEMARTFVILNPAAGSVKDVDALVERIRTLSDVEVCITAKAGEATQSTKTALRKGCEMVVAAGGDDGRRARVAPARLAAGAACRSSGNYCAHGKDHT